MFHIEWQYLIFPRYDVYLEIIVIHFIRFVVKKKTEGKEYKLMFRNCIMPMKTNTILFFYLDDLLSSEYGTLQLAMLVFFLAMLISLLVFTPWCGKSYEISYCENL